MLCREIHNGGTERVEDIRHTHEQQFFLFLKKKLPQAKIVYEESMFEITYDDGTTKGTVPDFYVTPNETKRAIIEITKAPRNSNSTKGERDDPKRKQKEIMKTVAPNVKYVVLYREDLERIQKHNPWVNFFGSTKVREDEPTH